MSEFTSPDHSSGEDPAEELQKGQKEQIWNLKVPEGGGWVTPPPEWAWDTRSSSPDWSSDNSKFIRSWAPKPGSAPGSGAVSKTESATEPRAGAQAESSPEPSAPKADLVLESMPSAETKADLESAPGAEAELVLESAPGPETGAVLESAPGAEAGALSEQFKDATSRQDDRPRAVAAIITTVTPRGPIPLRRSAPRSLKADSRGLGTAKVILPAAPVAKKAKEGKSNIWRIVIRDIAIPVAFAFAIAIFAQATLAKPYEIPSGSMLPTIQLKDRILANRFAYYVWPIKRGDVIVFQPPENVDTGTPYVKRVIGLPGDTVEIKKGKVLINGQELVIDPATTPTYTKPAETVPDGQLFVLGDNRNESADSHVWGYLPKDNIIGRADFIYWPPTHIKWLG